LEHLPQGGFHSLRRGWATQRTHLPIPDLMAAGGWADSTSLMTCYLPPDDATLAAVVAEPEVKKA
jgi:hypothetical protein